MNKKLPFYIVSLIMSLSFSAKANGMTVPLADAFPKCISIDESKMKAYLMVYHKDEDHGLHFAISWDGKRDTEWERPRKTYGWGNNKGIVMMK